MKFPFLYKILESITLKTATTLGYSINFYFGRAEKVASDINEQLRLTSFDNTKILYPCIVLMGDEKGENNPETQTRDIDFELYIAVESNINYTNAIYDQNYTQLNAIWEAFEKEIDKDYVNFLYTTQKLRKQSYEMIPKITDLGGILIDCIKLKMNKKINNNTKSNI